MIKEAKVAIIGGGPRGLSALESLYEQKALKNLTSPIFTLLFEKTDLPGAGPIYDVGQPDTNWLNLSERGLTLPGRKKIRLGEVFIPAFPSYQEWAGYKENDGDSMAMDQFPLRSTLGKYLRERFISIASILEKNSFLEVVQGDVIETSWEEGKFSIYLDGDNEIYYAKELVLTLGHQSTKKSEQMAKWLKYSSENNSVQVIEDAYPVSNILDSEILGSNSSVALRGFGLAMIDVMRALTVGLGGNFRVENDKTRKMLYEPSGKEPNQIIPFSLDGLPMAPKPLNLHIDRWFFPRDSERENLFHKLKKEAKSGSAQTHEFLINAMAPIISRVYNDLKNNSYSYRLKSDELHDIIKSWLLNAEFNHSLIVPKSNTAESTLSAFIDMATGTKLISLDFCAGHVWRHLQPTMYAALSFSNLDENVMASIIRLDERLKRYSYGPPVDSLQQLMALIDQDIVTLNFVNDPNIELLNSGWKLTNKNNSILADIMVNSVMDAPKLVEIDSPIINKLLNESMLEPLHTELGIDTHKNGCVVSAKASDQKPIAVLGRLSKGTLLGVDAILQCFGERSELWAEGVVDRVSSGV